MNTRTKRKKIKSLTQPYKFRKRYGLFDILLRKEKKFLYFIAVCLIAAGVFYPYPNIAMWVGFIFAGYSAIANDSIQTIGTFIASNESKKWYILWLFMGLIFLGTVSYSWYAYSGDVTYQRLASKGLEKAPESFVYLQLAAPIILLLLTRFRVPVSTTFMLLSVFSANTGTIVSMLNKSLLGYGIAFSVAIVIYLVASKLIKKLVSGEAHPAWIGAQWIISGALWHIWLVQDLANVAVYLPRQLNVYEFLAFSSFIFFGLGMIFFLKGDKIQDVISEKTEVKDVRSATIIDLIYAIILYFFKELSNIPMSTTWVFIGLLAGRELGIKISSHVAGTSYLKTLKLVGKDIVAVSVGLIISIILALAINPVIQKEVENFLFVK